MPINVNVAQITLKSLRVAKDTSPQNKVIRRIATRWLVATMALEYDRMIRLQYLEGVAHIPVNTWWKQGKNGLLKAMKHFEGEAIQNTWFDPGLTGMFPIINKTLKMLIGRYPSIHGTDPLDIG